MDLPLAIATASTGITGAAAIGMSIYALILRNRTARAETAAGVAVGKERLAEAKALAAITKLANAAETIERLEASLAAARIQKQETYADNAAHARPGAGDALDDTLRRMYPDADDHLAAAGGDAGSVPGDGTRPAARTAAGTVPSGK